MCGFLDRLELLADGATDAAKKRDRALNLERRKVKERCAQQGGTSSKVDLKKFMKQDYNI